MVDPRPAELARDAAVATILLAGLYLVGSEASHTVLVLPFYFLVVGFDVLELLFGPAYEYRSLLVGLYLLTLGTVCAGLLRLARGAVDGDGLGDLEAHGAASLRLGLAAPLLAVALLALGFAVVVGVGTGQLGPLAIAGGAGLVSLALALVVSGVPQRTLRASRADGVSGRVRR